MTDKNLTAVMALLFVGVLMGALDLAVIGPALPAIQSDFGLDNRQLSWLFNIYVLAQLVGTPLLAKASDKFGRRDVYIGCILGFAAGSLLLVIGGNYEMLFVGRGIQGFGASGIFPVAAAVIGDTFPEEKQGGALGLVGAVFGLAFLIGPVLGGILLQYAWEWLFLINIPIAAVLIIAAWRLLPSGGSGGQLPFDWTGAVLLTVMLGSLAIAITNLDTTQTLVSLLSLDVGPYLIISVISAPLFWRRELRAPDPVIRPSFFRSRRMKLVLMIAAGVGTTESAQVFLPALAVAALAVTESMAAWLMLPAVFVMIFVSPLVGKVVDKTGPAPVIRASLFFVFAGLLVYGFAAMNYVSFIGGSLVVGIGLAALLGAPMRYVILEEAAPQDRASAQGLLNIFLAIGQLGGAAIVGSVAASTGGGQAGYQSSFAVLGAITAALLMLAFLLRQKSTHPAEAGPVGQTPE